MSNSEKRPHLYNIILSTLAIAATVGGVYFAQRKPVPDRRFSIQVRTADSTMRPIQNAKVSLGIAQSLSENTGVNGTVLFKLPEEVIGQLARITVRADGFDPFEEQIVLRPREDYYPIDLRAAQVLPKPLPHWAQPKEPFLRDSVEDEVNAKDQDVLSQAHPSSVLVRNRLVSKEVKGGSREYRFEVFYQSPHFRFVTFHLDYSVTADHSGNIVRCIWGTDTGHPRPGTVSGHTDGCLNLFQ